MWELLSFSLTHRQGNEVIRLGVEGKDGNVLREVKVSREQAETTREGVSRQGKEDDVSSRVQASYIQARPQV